jgi:hypothetical protein
VSWFLSWFVSWFLIQRAQVSRASVTCSSAQVSRSSVTCSRAQVSRAQVSRLVVYTQSAVTCTHLYRCNDMHTIISAFVHVYASSTQAVRKQYASSSQAVRKQYASSSQAIRKQYYSSTYSGPKKCLKKKIVKNDDAEAPVPKCAPQTCADSCLCMMRAGQLGAASDG